MSDDASSPPPPEGVNPPPDAAGQDGPADAEGAVDAVARAAEDVVNGADAASLDLPEFNAEALSAGRASTLGLLDDVDLHVKVELGRTRMYVEDVLRLNANSVVELDKAAGDPVDIYVNDCHVARGEVLVLNENFCVRISEIIQRTVTDR